MRSWLPGLLLALLVTACAPQRQEPPPLAPQAPPGLPRRCADLFPQGPWQLVHQLNFQPNNGPEGSALGVVSLTNRELTTVLMSVEGLTLFAARSSNHAAPEVSRALPPFDSPHFAAGLMRDVRTLFQPPPGEAGYGRLPDGAPVCRYQTREQITDLLPREDGSWQLRLYTLPAAPETGRNPATPSLRLSRQIETRGVVSAGALLLPQTLTLTAADPGGYTLTMRLLSAEPFPEPPCHLP